MIKLISPKDGASVSVMTDVQKEFVRLHRAGDCEEIDRRLRELGCSASFVPEFKKES